MKITVKIGSEIYDFFTSVTLTLKYDGIASAFSITSYFDEKNESHIKLFKPLQYKLVQIYADDVLVLTGTILNVSFNEIASKQLATISGYSLPGILEDCNIPTSLYPLQSDNRTLKEIADNLCKPFGIGVEVDSSVLDLVNKPYKKTTADEKQSVKSYLTSLANQRNIILSHTPEGKLLFTKAKTNGIPIDNYKYLSRKLDISGQKIHSQITAIMQPKVEAENAAESNIENPFISNFRPAVVQQNSGDDNDTGDAAQNMIQAEMKNIKLAIDIDNIVWENGDLILPNNIIAVMAPELYLFNKVNFFIEQVTIKKDKSSESASLTAYLPQVYSGEKFVNIFE